jgi:hypothetical protein
MSVQRLLEMDLTLKLLCPFSSFVGMAPPPRFSLRSALARASASCLVPHFRGSSLLQGRSAILLPSLIGLSASRHERFSGKIPGPPATGYRAFRKSDLGASYHSRGTLGPRIVPLGAGGLSEQKQATQGRNFSQESVQKGSGWNQFFHRKEPVDVTQPIRQHPSKVRASGVHGSHSSPSKSQQPSIRPDRRSHARQAAGTLPAPAASARCLGRGRKAVPMRREGVCVPRRSRRRRNLPAAPPRAARADALPLLADHRTAARRGQAGAAEFQARS